MARYQDRTKPYPLLCSTRATISFMLFVGFVLFYGLRVNLSVGLICMVNHTAFAVPDSTRNDTSPAQATSACGYFSRNITEVVKDGPLAWSKQTQGFVLSAFFWGYSCTQILGGWLAARYGAKRILFLTIGISSLLTIAMPEMAKLHYMPFLILRMIMGALHGMVWPASQVLWTRWAPLTEKSRLMGFSYAGSQVGNVITMPISGLLCVYGFDGGWPSVFYVFGIVGALWSLAWLTVASDSPGEHRWMATKERDYIQQSLKGQISEKKSKTPWLAILRSPAVWAITVSNCCGDFGIYIFLTNLPTYLKEVLGFAVETSGFLSALPYIAFWMVINFSATIGDFLLERRVCTLTTVRKISNTIGLVGPSIAIFALTFLGCDAVWTAVTLLSTGVALCGCMYGAGFLVNPGDISPEYAGIILGISNTMGSVSGMFGPVLVGIMTPNRSAAEWKHVFYMTSAIMVAGAIFYLIFGSGKVEITSLETAPCEVELKDQEEAGEEEEEEEKERMLA